ncbi:unnamed protein product [Owenia fusiformis]|uniref:Uncharacterized protein n=1 Tax=Owenia fusiformis TaxID=6347 RepID=A0A8J1XMC6_OWEFU|nr:unnamed protein product [Owenia fusiformis]
MERNTSSIQNNEETPLLTSTLMSTTPKVYKRRWYILAVFSGLTLIQAGVWNSWGPIADTSSFVYGWKHSDIALLLNWGPIGFFIAAVPSFWLLDVAGLRWSAVLGSIFVCLGTGIRCLALDLRPMQPWLIHVGQALNALAGPLLFAGPVVVSAVWFPIHEQTRAVAIGTTAGTVGMAMSFILGPLLVRDIAVCNQTSIPKHQSLGAIYRDPQYDFIDNSTSPVCPIVNRTDLTGARKDIQKLMYIEWCYSGVLLLLALLYFPKQPPTPPSIAAGTQRTNFTQGLKAIVKNKKFWLIALPYGLPMGFYGVWSNFIDAILEPLNIQQEEAGWIGFWAIVGGSVTSLIVGSLLDYFKHRLKHVTVGIYIGALVSTVWLILICREVLPFSKVCLYIAAILSGGLVNTPPPLLYELACQNSYPIGEGVTSGMMAIVYNIAAMTFLLIMMVPSMDTSWLNFGLLGCVCLAVPLLLILRESFNRLDLDERAPGTPKSGKSGPLVPTV